jgi:prepilin-type N-terminal cleavage/methylation domain-containing protein
MFDSPIPKMVAAPSKALASCRAAHHALSGFSLVELLVVVAVIGLLALLAAPAFNSIGSAMGTVDAAYKISDAIELARSEAVARRTFVWLGFQDSTNFGSRVLRFGAAYSKNGFASIDEENLQPLFRPVALDRVGLVANADTGKNNSNYADAVALATNGTGANFSLGSYGNSAKTLTFTPTGEAMLTGLPNSSTQFEEQILIGLRQFRGTSAETNNDIAVVLDGSTGIPRVYRKQ